MTRTFPDAAIAAIALGALACTDGSPAAEAPTVLRVAVWTDLAIPRQIDSIRAVLWQGSVQRYATRLLSDSGEDQPIVLTLATDWMLRTEPVDLQVEAHGGSLILVTRRVRIPRLRPGASVVAVTLETRCAAVSCGPDWTCVGGRCERPDVPLEAVVASVEDLPADPLPPASEGRRIDGCVTDLDCEDGDPCTVDTCAAHQCSRTEVFPCRPCATDPDCTEVSTQCMEAFCGPRGLCSWRSRPPETPCDCGDDPCVVCCCREMGTCMGFDICLDPSRVSECDGI